MCCSTAMNYLWFLVIIKSVLCIDNPTLVINHGDHETKLVTNNGNYYVNTFHKDYVPSTYVLKNENTKETVDFVIPKRKTDTNSILHQARRVSNNGQGSYSYYATANHQTRQDYINTENNNLEVFGSSSYVDPNGNLNIVKYTAGKNGYRTKVSFGTKVKYSIYDELVDFLEELERRGIKLSLDELGLRAKDDKNKGKQVDPTLGGILLGGGYY